MCWKVENRKGRLFPPHDGEKPWERIFFLYIPHVAIQEVMPCGNAKAIMQITPFHRRRSCPSSAWGASPAGASSDAVGDRCPSSPAWRYNRDRNSPSPPPFRFSPHRPDLKKLEQKTRR